MAREDRLFLLIKSLTRSEKRHFQMSLDSNGRTLVHGALFKAMDRQKVYDEKAIRAHFRDHPTVRQLHVTKNHLARMILRSLRTFYATGSKEAEIRQQLHDIEILFRRDLLDHCNRAIIRAEQQARKFERYELLLSILNWKRRVYLTRDGALDRQGDLQDVVAEEGECIRRLHIINEYQRLILETATYAGDPTRYAVRSTPVPDPDPKDSLRMRILHSHLRAADLTFAGHADQAEATLDALLSVLDQHPERVAHDPESYVTILSNKVGFALRRGDGNAVIRILDEIRAVPDRFSRGTPTTLPVRTVLRTYNIQLEHYRDTRDAHRGIALISEVEGYLRRHKRSVPRDYAVLFNYQFAYLYFLGGRYSDALRSLNVIIDGSWGMNRPDIQTAARFLHLIIHYELGNISLLRYAVESCRRFLRKKRDLESYEKTLLRFFANLSTAPPREHGVLIGKLQSVLFTPGNEQLDSNVLDYLDFKTWLTQKVNEYRPMYASLGPRSGPA